MVDISSYIVHSNPKTGSMKTVHLFMRLVARKATKVGGRSLLQSLSYAKLDQHK